MYSISTNFFPDHKEAMIGYLEAVTGVGLIMGPLIGSMLYAIGGYLFIFYTFGSIFIIFSFFISSIFTDEIDRMAPAIKDTENSDDFKRPLGGRVFPKKNEKVASMNMTDDDFFNQTSKINIADIEQGSEEQQYVVGTFELLCIPKYLLACMSATLGYFLYSFMEPVLALRAGDFNLT